MPIVHSILQHLHNRRNRAEVQAAMPETLAALEEFTSSKARHMIAPSSFTGLKLNLDGSERLEGGTCGPRITLGGLMDEVVLSQISPWEHLEAGLLLMRSRREHKYEAVRAPRDAFRLMASRKPNGFVSIILNFAVGYSPYHFNASENSLEPGRLLMESWTSGSAPLNDAGAARVVRAALERLAAGGGPDDIALAAESAVPEVLTPAPA